MMGFIPILFFIAIRPANAQTSNQTNQVVSSNIGYVPGYSVKLYPDLNGQSEIVSERTQTTKTILLGNGSAKLMSFAGPIHYKKGNKWEDIDLTILPNQSGTFMDYPYANLGNSFQTYYSSNPTQQPIITITEDGHKITEMVTKVYASNSKNKNSVKNFKLSATVVANLEGQNIIYSDIYPSLDIKYSQNNMGRNFDLIIRDRSFIEQIPSQFQKLMIEETVTIPENWIAVKEDNTINFYVGTQIMASIPQPMMREDSRAAKNYKSEEDFLCKGDITFEREGNTLKLITGFPLDWMREEARVFPLALDPIWTIKPTNATYWTGYQSSSSAKNNGMLYIGSTYTAWAKFNIPNVAGATVMSVKYYGASYYPGQEYDKYVYIHSMGTVDPVADVAANIWNAITGGAIFTSTYRWNNPVTKNNGTSAPTVDDYTGSDALGAAANTYVQSRMGNFISLGFNYASGDNSYYNAQGAYNSVAPPYIEVIYCTGACSGTPTAGTLSAQGFACSGQNFALKLAGPTLSCGITMQWQKSTSSASGPWSTFGNEMREDMTTSQTATTWYRVSLLCSNSGLSSSSNVIQVNTVKNTYGADSYTIDKGSAATRKNFQSFTNLSDSLSCHGISAAITVNVVSASGPYNEQLILKKIPGSSTSKTITINGNGETLQFNSTTAANNFVLEFGQDASYYTFKNMKMTNTNTSFARILHLPKNNEYITFDNVEFIGYKSATTSVNHAIVYEEPNVISNFWSFKNCKFTDGSYGLYIYSSSSNGAGQSAQNLRVENCQFIDQYYMGIRVYYYAGLQFYRNLIYSTKSYTNYNGMYLYWIMCPIQDNRTIIDGNKIYYNNGGYGMYLQYLGVNTSYPSVDWHFLISNNVINIGPGPSLSTLTRGIYITNQSNSQFYHNTVNVSSGDNTNSAGFWFQGAYTTSASQGRVDLLNNLFSSEGNAAAFYLGSTNITTTNVTIDNNNLYSKGSSLGNYIGSMISDIATWRSTSGYDLNSGNLDPAYQDDSRPYSNLHITNAALHDKTPYLSSIPYDADLRVRKSTGTDPGGLVSIKDLSVTMASSTFTAPFCGRDYPIDLQVTNTGNFPFVGDIYFKIKINGGTRVYLDTISYNLSPGESKSLVMNRAVNLVGGRINTIEISILNTDEQMSNNAFTYSSPYLDVSPSGSVLTKVTTGTGVAPTEQHPFWKSIAGETWTYKVSAPNGFANGDYGMPTGYNVYTRAYEKIGGNLLPPSTTTYTHNMVTGGEWTLNIPDKSYDGKAIIYELRFENVATLCDSTILMEVLVVDDGTPDFQINSTTCEHTIVEIENLSTVSSGYLSHKWDFGNGEVSSKTNPTPIYNTAGTYQITLRTRTVPFGFEKTITKSITINPTPNATFVHTDACFGSPITLTNTSTNIVGVPTTEWDYGDGQTGVSTNGTAIYNNPGRFIVTLTVTSDKGCIDIFQKGVTSYAIPVPNFDFPALKCMGNGVQFDNKTTIAFSNWSSVWKFGAGEGSSTDKDPLYSFKNIGNANVKLIAKSEFGCTDSITKLVKVEPSPIINIINSDACVGLPTIFNSNVDVPGGLTVDYKWNIDFVNYTDATPSVIFKYADYESVNLTATFSNGCKSSASIRVQSVHKPKSDFIVKGSVCSGEMIDIYNTTVVKFGTPKYTWIMGDGKIYNNELAPKHVYSNNAPKDYSITLVSKSMLGTCPDSITKTISAGVTPICDFTSNHNYTFGYRGFDFKAISQSGVQYAWDFGDGSTSSEQSPTHQFTRDAVFNVKLKITSPEGCSCEKILGHSVANLDVSDVLTNAGINVYPNPTTGVINFANSGSSVLSSVTVVNALGSVVLSNTLNSLENVFTVDLTGHAAGVYLIQIKTFEGKIYTQKIILEK